MIQTFKNIFSYKHSRVVAILGIIAVILSVFTASSSFIVKDSTTGNITSAEYIGTDLFLPSALFLVFCYIAFRLKKYNNTLAAIGASLISVSWISNIFFIWKGHISSLKGEIMPKLFLQGETAVVGLAIIGSVILAIGLARRSKISNDYFMILFVLITCFQSVNNGICTLFIFSWLLFELKNKQIAEAKENSTQKIY